MDSWNPGIRQDYSIVYKKLYQLFFIRGQVLYIFCFHINIVMAITIDFLLCLIFGPDKFVENLWLIFYITLNTIWEQYFDDTAPHSQIILWVCIILLFALNALYFYTKMCKAKLAEAYKELLNYFTILKTV